MASDENENRPSEEGLPACGIYRTTAPLSQHEEQVKEGRLVYFHSHSKQGPPILLLPASNSNNRWKFHSHGYLVEDKAYCLTLKPLLAEGFYVLRGATRTEKGVLAARSLVQLGYNAKAEPILFTGRLNDENAISFPTRGFRFKEDIFKELEPCGFVVQAAEKTSEETPERVLH